MVWKERQEMQITRGEMYVEIRLDPMEATVLAAELRLSRPQGTAAIPTVAAVLSAQLDGVLTIPKDAEERGRMEMFTLSEEVVYRVVYRDKLQVWAASYTEALAAVDAWYEAQRLLLPRTSWCADPACGPLCGSGGHESTNLLEERKRMCSFVTLCWGQGPAASWANPPNGVA